MTIAERLIQKGEKKGVKKGVNLTLQAMDAFIKGKDINYVMRKTALTEEELTKIQKKALLYYR